VTQNNTNVVTVKRGNIIVFFVLRLVASAWLPQVSIGYLAGAISKLTNGRGNAVTHKMESLSVLASV
jgi:hypothetical protein